MSRPSHPFEVRSRDVLRIALPASVAFITEPLAGLNDITVIGRLGDAALLSGLVIGALAFDFLFSMAFFLRTGTAGLTAQAVGARDPQDGLVHIGRAIATAIGVGLLMIALSFPLLWLTNVLLAPPSPEAADALAEYFLVRIWCAPFSLINFSLLGWYYGRGAARTGMMLQVLIHVVDIALSILFVYGFGWGIFGAALGTVLGQVAAALAGLVLVTRHYGGLRRLLPQLQPRELLDPFGVRRMLGISRDLMLRSMALNASYGFFAAQGARMGEVALSANAILLNFLMLSGYFLDGLSQAAEALCGKAVGANYRPAYLSAYALSFRWGVLVALGLAFVWFVGGSLVIDFMTTSESIRAYARDFLWVAALSSLTGMPAFLYDGILIGSTLNRTMRNGMIAAFVVFLASCLILQPLLGNIGLWLSIHIFFLARAGYYWQALDRRMASLFD